MMLHLVVLATVGAVVALGVFGPWPPDPVEMIWTALGAGGTVYGVHVLRRRWQAELWRRRQRTNGLVALLIHAHLVLRGAGCAMQVLIVVAGLGAMTNANRLLILWSIIGIAALSTFSAWYAERAARQQESYYRTHLEG